MGKVKKVIYHYSMKIDVKSFPAFFFFFLVLGMEAEICTCLNTCFATELYIPSVDQLILSPPLAYFSSGAHCVSTLATLMLKSSHDSVPQGQPIFKLFILQI